MTQIKNLLFLCPHAAAKSVFAMTYFADAIACFILGNRLRGSGYRFLPCKNAST
jgi:hypothetical protein